MITVKFFLSAIVLFFSLASLSQIKAVTETGEEVLLFSNGTWKYTEAVKDNEEILTNEEIFKKPASANFLLKSKHAEVGFWVDPKKWNFEKGASNSPAEYNFSLKENNSVMAMVVSEPMGMDLMSLRKFALNNIQEVSSSFKILKEEYRMVNGLKILKIEAEATVEGINFSYINYYYSDSLSTIQFLGFTAKTLIRKNAALIEELLNGFVTTAGFNLAEKSNLQSSLSGNSNCKKIFNGKWSYTAAGKKYLDKIEKGRIVETSYTDKYISIYKMRWIDSCTYEIRLEQSDDPVSKFIKKGEPMIVEIVEISDTKMRYQLTYQNNITKGEMKKEE